MISESVQRRASTSAAPPLVAWYSAYRQAGLPPGTASRPAVPVPDAHRHPGRSADRGRASRSAPRPASTACSFGGLHTVPALITHDGRQSGIQLQVTPLGARALLGLPAGELAGLDLEADDVLGPFAAELRSRVRAAGTWAQRFAVLDDLLLRRAVQRESPGSPRPEVAYAWRALLASRGARPIADLSRDTGWTARHLRRAVPGRVRPQPQGCGQGGALRPRPPAPAAPGRGRPGARAG